MKNRVSSKRTLYVTHLETNQMSYNILNKAVNQGLRVHEVNKELTGSNSKFS